MIYICIILTIMFGVLAILFAILRAIAMISETVSDFARAWFTIFTATCIAAMLACGIAAIGLYVG